MLPRLIDKIKSYQYHIFLVVCVILICLTSYNLGKINALGKLPLKVSGGELLKSEGGSLKADIYSATEPKNQELEAKTLDLRVVVSKSSSSKKYHYSWCSSWKRITANNQLWFENEEAAIKAGYTLAGNCSP